MNVSTTIEYIIGQLEGLEDLRHARCQVKSEQELAYWKLSAEKWFFGNEILRQFDRRQVRVDLGRKYPITIVEEHPELNLRNWALRADTRLVEQRNELVSAIRMHTTFERQPGEPDPRGAYRLAGMSGMRNAMVSLVDAKYRLVAEVIHNHASLNVAMKHLIGFALDIIRGAVKPEAFTTVS